MADMNPTHTSNDLTNLKATFKPELEKAQALINGIEPPSLKDFAYYFQGIDALKAKSQQTDPNDTLGWANIINDSILKGFERLKATPVNGGNVTSIRRILESSEKISTSETLNASIKAYRVSLSNTNSIYEGEAYEDAASSDGSYSWVIYIAGLVIFNILSYIFDWGWILY